MLPHLFFPPHLCPSYCVLMLCCSEREAWGTHTHTHTHTHTLLRTVGNITLINIHVLASSNADVYFPSWGMPFMINYSLKQVIKHRHPLFNVLCIWKVKIDTASRCGIIQVDFLIRQHVITTKIEKTSLILIRFRIFLENTKYALLSMSQAWRHCNV